MAVGDTHFIEEFGAQLKADCFQNEPPFCEVACPFHLPIREMEDKWTHGRWNAVYRAYQTAVAFPAIVHRICSRPCEKVCILKNRGGSLSLGAIEEATVRLAKRTKPNAFNLPSKRKKVAIIGGGMAGLGCALRLCNKKYEVAIYEKSEHLGGRARSMMDENDFDAEIQNQFREEHPQIFCQQEIKDLEALRKAYDAVFVSTGHGGQDFGRKLTGEGAFAGDLPGVFLGGELTGAEDPIYALAEGLRASMAVERYIKIALMNEPEDYPKTRLVIDEERIPVEPQVVPQDPAVGYNAEEVAREVARCRKCSCDICRKECDLMRIQEKTPGRLYEEAYITVRPSTLANDGRWATRRIASCDQCGLCKTVCPQDIDMGQFLMQSHRGLKDTNAMPWAFHDYWLRDMEFSIGEAGFLIQNPGVRKNRYVLFPGCQFAASDPSLAEEVMRWTLAKVPDSAVWMNCCGAPAVWAAEDEWQEDHMKELWRSWRDMGQPTMIFACPTCRKMFDRFLPEIPKMFLEEALLQWGVPALEKASGPFVSEVKFAVFDPCAGRDYPEFSAAVRSLADQLGVTYEELPHHGKFARCCSYGGQYAIAAPEYAMRVKMERAEESPLPYITSCMNCRDTFASRGKENLHILDLAFGRDDRRRETPLITARRENRLLLKKKLLAEFCNQEMKVREPAVKMICSEELERKLSGQHILLTDMEDVIAFCEAEKRGVLHPDGSITGHLKIGHMTYWAVYLPREDGSYELRKGYSHRMNLEGE